jgi:hypothetical protein
VPTGFQPRAAAKKERGPKEAEGAMYVHVSVSVLYQSCQSVSKE